MPQTKGSKTNVFQRPERQNHGVGRIGSSKGPWGRVCPMPLSLLLVAPSKPWCFLPYRCITPTPASISTWPDPSICLCPIASPFLWRSQPLDLGSTLNSRWSHLKIFNLITSAKILFPKQLTSAGHTGGRCSTRPLLLIPQYTHIP